MSLLQPGILHDATNSWNGYNHQGKIALWYVIKTIISLWDNKKSTSENMHILEPFFLEIEYMEDFSIGKQTETDCCYLSVHQVKARKDKDYKKYESALIGLLIHAHELPDLKKAYLHTTEQLSLMGNTLGSILKDLRDNSKHIENKIKAIKNGRAKKEYREKLISNKGRPSKLKKDLKSALGLSEKDHLIDANLDSAFDALLIVLEEEQECLRHISDTNLSKVSLYTYPSTDNFCPIDQAPGLLQNTLKNYFIKSNPKGWKVSSNEHLDKLYYFMLGQLDKEILKRHLHYCNHNCKDEDRRISFKTIIEWLETDDDFGESFYLYHLKEHIFSTMDSYCKGCKLSTVHCDKCHIAACKNKLGEMPFDKLEEFLRVTNPHVCGSMDIRTYPFFASTAGLKNPFCKGLRDILQSFADEKSPIVFYNSEHHPYVLTTIFREGADNDCETICNHIIQNEKAYELMMDYDSLISKDIQSSSVLTDSGVFYGDNVSEHIAHCKDVRIFKLEDCKHEFK